MHKKHRIFPTLEKQSFSLQTFSFYALSMLFSGTLLAAAAASLSANCTF